LVNIRFKKGVKVRAIQPEIVLAIPIVASVFAKFNNAECVITSAREGTHMKRSMHYVGYALDFRTRHIAVGWHEKLAKEVRRALTDEYDVVLEKTHLHVEYDPT